MGKKRAASQSSRSKKKQAVEHRPPSPDPMDLIRQKVAGRPLHQEREFPCYHKCAFYRLAVHKLGLRKLLEPRGTGNETFVRHCYAYSKHWSLTSVQFRGFPPGGYNLITPEVIRQFYDMPFHPECHYYQMKDQDEDQYPLEAIANTLLKPGEDRWLRPGGKQLYLRQACLNREARIWLQFITYNVSPISHRTYIPKEMALLMYLLMTKQPVKLEIVIYDAIYHCVESMRNNLVHPHLISDIFKQAGVPEHDGDSHFQPLPPFKYDQVKKDKRPVDELGQPITLGTIHDKLLRAEQNRERDARRLRRVETILERLALKMEVELPSEIESEQEDESQSQDEGEEDQPEAGSGTEASDDGNGGDADIEIPGSSGKAAASDEEFSGSESGEEESD